MLWLKVKDDRLYFINASGVDKSSIPYSVPIDSQNPIGQAVIEDRVVEIVDMNSLGTLKKIAEREGFVYSVFVPMKLKNSIIGCLAFFKNRDFPMNASERATITLFSTQAASAISIARLYEELKNEKDFSDAIFNHTVSGIMVLDKEGRIVKINRAAVEILQVLPKEVMNKRVEEIHPGLKDMLFITAGSREIDIASKSGVPRTIGYINSPLFDKDGREKGIIVVFRDITDIKRLQAEIRKKQHFEALGKVISGVAHEIRNPLFAVHSIAQILEREIDSESHQLLIQTMLKETNRMKRLVDELLFYSRPSKLQITEIRLESLFNELKEYVRTKHPGINFSIITSAPITLKVDRDRLIQVFRNLIDNAVDAQSEKIEIVAEKKNDTVVISIIDDGVGIKESDIERVFDLFFTTKKDGTGLGLAICRKIIEDHNGDIEIESAEGKGTTLKLILKTGS
jgi:PAS domain S-box-containing protein